jgi:hypothetical protein
MTFFAYVDILGGFMRVGTPCIKPSELALSLYVAGSNDDRTEEQSRESGKMDKFRFKQLTVGLLVKREGGMFRPSGLGVFYDPTKKGEKTKYKSAYGEYDEETIYGKNSRIGGKHKYPNVDPMTVAEIYFETMNLGGH